MKTPITEAIASPIYNATNLYAYGESFGNISKGTDNSFLIKDFTINE